VTGAAYLNILHESTVPAVSQLMKMRTCGINTPHFHLDMRAYLDKTSSDRWIGGRESVEYLPRSPELTPHLSLSCLAIEELGVQHKVSNTSRALVRNGTVLCSHRNSNFGGLFSVTHHGQLCHEADGGHFEHLHYID
jgi:hypothetical protein